MADLPDRFVEFRVQCTRVEDAERAELLGEELQFHNVRRVTLDMLTIMAVAEDPEENDVSVLWFDGPSTTLKVQAPYEEVRDAWVAAIQAMTAQRRQLQVVEA